MITKQELVKLRKKVCSVSTNPLIMSDILADLDALIAKAGEGKSCLSCKHYGINDGRCISCRNVMLANWQAR